MVSENNEIIYSIRNPILLVPVIRVTKNKYTSTESRATSPRILYLTQKGQLLYPTDEGKEEIEMIKAELGSYAFGFW